MIWTFFIYNNLILGSDVLFCLVSSVIIGKLTLCKLYFEQIGNFKGKYNTIEKQAELILRCSKMHQKAQE